MNSYKCSQCGLTNWVTAEFCKRCKSPNLQFGYNQQTAAYANNPRFDGYAQQQNSYAQQNQQPNYQPQNYTPATHSQTSSAQQNYAGFPQQNDYSAPPPPNTFGAAAGTANYQGDYRQVEQQFYPSLQQRSYTQINTVCGMCGVQSNNMKKLYEDDVCRSCHRKYISRRQAAFLLDLIVYRGIATLIIFSLLGAVGDSLGMLGILLSFVPVLLRDATNGVSLGKAVAGLKTIDFVTKQPCGIGKSIARNIILYVPFMLIIELVFIQSGRRLGDRMVDTRVVWKKYENARVFWK